MNTKNMFLVVIIAVIALTAIVSLPTQTIFARNHQHNTQTGGGTHTDQSSTNTDNVASGHTNTFN